MNMNAEQLTFAALTDLNQIFVLSQQINSAESFNKLRFSQMKSFFELKINKTWVNRKFLIVIGMNSVVKKSYHQSNYFKTWEGKNN